MLKPIVIIITQKQPLQKHLSSAFHKTNFAQSAVSFPLTTFISTDTVSMCRNFFYLNLHMILNK